jgi:hypothetical protein
MNAIPFFLRVLLDDGREFNRIGRIKASSYGRQANHGSAQKIRSAWKVSL